MSIWIIYLLFIHVFCAFQIIINNTNALLYFEILYALQYIELVFPQIFLPLLVLIEILSKENIAFLRNFDWRIPIYYFNKDRNKRQIPIVGILKEFTFIYFYKYIHVNR